MKITASTEELTVKFRRAMLRLGAASGADLRQTVETGAVMFARSAARATPPAAGKSIPAKLFKRVVKASPYVISGGTKIHLSPQKYLNGLQPLKGAKADYIVLTKIPRRRRFKAAIFDNLSAARRAQKIGTRGLLRAGWWAALGHLGQAAAEKYGEAVTRMLQAIHAFSETSTDAETSISMTNRVDEGHGSEEAKKLGMRVGLARASNAMKAMADKKTKELIQRQGGKA